MNHKGNWLGKSLDKFGMNKEKFTRAGFEPATSLALYWWSPYFVNIFVRGGGGGGSQSELINMTFFWKMSVYIIKQLVTFKSTMVSYMLMSNIHTCTRTRTCISLSIAQTGHQLRSDIRNAETDVRLEHDFREMIDTSWWSTYIQNYMYTVTCESSSFTSQHHWLKTVIICHTLESIRSIS